MCRFFRKNFFQSDLFTGVHEDFVVLALSCRIANPYTQYGRIANPPERNEIRPNEKLYHTCNYSTIIFTKVNKNTIISLKLYLFANMTVFLLKNILFSQ